MCAEYNSKPQQQNNGQQEHPRTAEKKDNPLRRMPVSRCFSRSSSLYDLRLHGYVQNAHRLIGNDDVRFHDHGAYDAYTLPLSARKLMRESVRIGRGESDLGEGFHGTVVERLFVPDKDRGSQAR